MAKVSAGGVPQWVIYMGGSGDDSANGIALDSSGRAVVVGTTSSTDFADGQNGAGGATDAFVAVLSPGGSLRTAFCLAMSGRDTGSAIVLDASGDALVRAAPQSTPRRAGRAPSRRMSRRCGL